MMRICDLCAEDSLKNELRNELVSEIWALERELETTQRENDRHRTDDQQQRQEIRQLEEDLSVGRLARQQTLEALKAKIEDEIKKGMRVKESTEDIRRIIDQLNLEEQQVTKEIKAQQGELAVLQIQISDKTLELLRLQGQDRYLEEQLSDRVSKDELVSLLCEECFGAVELL
jgi:chromosome segregation ATPase